MSTLIGKLGIWAGLTAVIVIGLMFGAVANSVASSPHTTTYTVKAIESGLPSGTKWSATLNGVTNSGTGTTITFTGVAASTYYLYIYTFTSSSNVDIQYVTSNAYNYITVPNELAVSVSFTTQYYTTFAVSPSGSGTADPGTGWYNAGSEVAIAADSAVGYGFSKWTVSPSKDFVLGKNTQAATEVQVNGVGTITAEFKASTTAATFYEVGLPTGTSWGVTFDGAGTSSTSTSQKTASHDAGNYAWSVAPVSVGSTVQYAPQPASADMNMPYQTSQEIVFVKQFLVTFATTPSGTGTVSPNGAAYYTNNSVFPIFAYNTATYVFSKWSGNESKVGLGSTSVAGTNATVKASTTITATFKSGSECTTCSLTFSEIGLPGGASWGVTVGSSNYATTSSSVTVSGLTAAQSWSAFEPVSTGQFEQAYIPAYIGTTYTGSGYWPLGSTANIEVVYTPYSWVTFVESPSYSGSQTLGTGWYATGATYGLSAIGAAAESFSSWSSSGKNLTLGSTSSASTTVVVKGPGTITVNFVQPTTTLHFVEYGLPKGTTWGVQLTSPTATWFTSSTPWINITGVAYTSYGWSPLTAIYAGTGLQWSPWSYYGAVDAPYETYGSVVYSEQAYLSFAVSDGATAGGAITPSTSNYYWIGEVVTLNSENTSGANFTSWSDTAGTGTISTTSAASTFVTVAGTGTVTAKFT